VVATAVVAVADIDLINQQPVSCRFQPDGLSA